MSCPEHALTLRAALSPVGGPDAAARSSLFSDARAPAANGTAGRRNGPASLASSPASPAASPASGCSGGKAGRRGAAEDCGAWWTCAARPARRCSHAGPGRLMRACERARVRACEPSSPPALQPFSPPGRQQAASLRAGPAAGISAPGTRAPPRPHTCRIVGRGPHSAHSAHSAHSRCVVTRSDR